MLALKQDTQPMIDFVAVLYDTAEAKCFRIRTKSVTYDRAYEKFKCYCMGYNQLYENQKRNSALVIVDFTSAVNVDRYYEVTTAERFVI